MKYYSDKDFSDYFLQRLCGISSFESKRRFKLDRDPRCVGRQIRMLRTSRARGPKPYRTYQTWHTGSQGLVGVDWFVVTRGGVVWWHLSSSVSGWG